MRLESYTTIIAALLGAILGATGTYWFSLKKAEIDARRVAGAKLRAAFAPEIAKYNLIADNDLRPYDEQMKAEEMFKEALPRHAAAIEEYRCFIAPDVRSVYQKMWENYFRPPCANGSIYFSEYVDVDNGGRELFKKRIDAILKFTED
jgi:hypothetical protein